MFYNFLEDGITVTEQQKMQKAEHAKFILSMTARDNKKSRFLKALSKI